MDQERIVLVVEDERPLAEAIKAKLQKNNFSVVTVRTAQQAFETLEDLERVDAIWLDHYLLGREDGLDFIAKIKHETSPHKNIAVFVVSNTATADKVHTYLHLGAEKYYVKAEHRLENIVNDVRKFFDK